MTALELTADRLEAARLAATGNWNIVEGSASSDPVLMEMVMAQLLALIYTAHLRNRGLDGVRLTHDGEQWLARAEQESQR